MGGEVTERECNRIHSNTHRHNSYVSAVKKLAIGERRTFPRIVPHTFNPQVDNAIVRIRGKMDLMLSEHILPNGVKSKRTCLHQSLSSRTLHYSDNTIVTHRAKAARSASRYQKYLRHSLQLLLLLKPSQGLQHVT